MHPTPAIEPELATRLTAEALAVLYPDGVVPSRRSNEANSDASGASYQTTFSLTTWQRQPEDRYGPSWHAAPDRYGPQHGACYRGRWTCQDHEGNYHTE